MRDRLNGYHALVVGQWLTLRAPDGHVALKQTSNDLNHIGFFMVRGPMAFI